MNLTFTLTQEQLAELACKVAPLVASEIGHGAAESPWFSLAEAAHYLGVSERTLERGVANRRLRSTTLGRRRLFHRDDLDGFARAAGEE